MVYDLSTKELEYMNYQGIIKMVKITVMENCVNLLLNIDSSELSKYLNNTTKEEAMEIQRVYRLLTEDPNFKKKNNITVRKAKHLQTLSELMNNFDPEEYTEPQPTVQIDKALEKTNSDDEINDDQEDEEIESIIIPSTSSEAGQILFNHEKEKFKMLFKK
ncbi:uncharacterized protein LOC128389113 [Panonychus citri]|uniref:uncharacterized protein LOC128389113 n=1 Tax=Panonychus citri TaxID=50023 RepID=UPI0023072499|nr:uncharacterized protein LOC128389113 [Panonychus citri]